MRLPVACVQIHIADGVSGVDHPTVAHIDAHMGNARRVIGAHEEHQIARAHIGGGYRGTDIAKPLCPQAAHVPPAVIDDPRHEARAVERGLGAAAAPK